MSTLKPSISPCITDNCETLNLTENTGIYSTSNTSGFGAPNIDPSAVDSAILVITTPSGTVITEDILSQLPATYIGPFELNSIDIDAEDGEYTIVYTIVDGEITYTQTYCYFSSCVVRCCIDKLWAIIIDKELDTTINCECDANELTKLQNKAMFMEALYKEMLCSATWNNVTTRNKILVQLKRLCKINDCDCGCS